MKTAIAFLTKDRIDLSKQSIKPLLDSGADIFWIDGSSTEEGKLLPYAYPVKKAYGNITGGAGAGIVFALTTMLASPENYTHVGLTENDVLLEPGWFEPTTNLFALGAGEALNVGAVSARCYEDRVLVQRDGYALCHNLGAGQVIFTREAAKIILNTFRSGWTSDNRRIFAQLSGIDIGRYWAFRGGDHWLVADWNFDSTLAAHGFASLALTPAKCGMIGQNPPLAEQGLVLASGPIEALRSRDAFVTFKNRTSEIREGHRQLGVETYFHHDVSSSTWTYFAPHIPKLRGCFDGVWGFREQRGFGEFSWVSDPFLEGVKGFYTAGAPTLEIPLFGPACFLVSGGKNGGKIKIEDPVSGFSAEPEMPPEGDGRSIMQMIVPGSVNYREVTLTALTPGVVFLGVQTREKQPFDPSVRFDYSTLPRAV